MKKNLIKWMAAKNWMYNLAVKLIVNRIVHSQKHLTPEYLTARGWIEENGDFVEPDVKDRDKIWITFENHYYRVWHGKNRTFIGLESTVEWFENYYILTSNNERLYN